eukprot:CAMPEP_0172605998 /NCGR_PEP_ID=MMETSP1068-20121228/26180_1 /TAXON_ID=35684 /ORGANISM="Pseudopedinella elastica, Strain CCMP716" /LENGTH=385 /DNA_ID=CAMNT_0013408561 /DNA_START=234 /DNA_END=1391 /DNA_ORIENTATION=-
MAAQSNGRTLGMYAVFDGHGLTTFAMEAAREKILDKIAPPDANTPIMHHEIVEAFEAVGMHIMDSKVDRTGTTATVVCVAGYMKDPTKPRFTVTAAWVGDSRCCMMTPSGKILNLSVDHQLSNPSERRRIEAESDAQARENNGLRTTFIARRQNNRGDQGPWALFHAEPNSYTIDEAELSQELDELTGAGLMDLTSRGRINATSTLVTRALGDAHGSDSLSPTPDILRVQNVKPGSRIIIGSDGLWDVFKNPDAFRIIKGFKDPRRAAKRLAEAAKERRTHRGLSKDDITVFVIDVDVPSSDDDEMDKTLRAHSARKKGRIDTEEVSENDNKVNVTSKGLMLKNKKSKAPSTPKIEEASVVGPDVPPPATATTIHVLERSSGETP